MYLFLGEGLGKEISYVGCYILWFLGIRKFNLNNFLVGCLFLRLFYEKLDFIKRDVVKFRSFKNIENILMLERVRE